VTTVPTVTTSAIETGNFADSDNFKTWTYSKIQLSGYTNGRYHAAVVSVTITLASPFIMITEASAQMLSSFTVNRNRRRFPSAVYHGCRLVLLDVNAMLGRTIYR